MAHKGDKTKNVSPQIKPGVYALGSAASRAAARALLEERDQRGYHFWYSVVGAKQVAPLRIRRCGGGLAFIYGAGFEDYDPECTEIYHGAKSRETQKPIEVLPQISRDPDKIGDCIKFDGDDAADCGRYGLKSFLHAAAKPFEARVIDRVELAEKIARSQGREFDINARMMAVLMAQAEEKKRARGWQPPRRFGKFVGGRRVCR